MEAKYKVITLSVSGRGSNKIHRLHDIVTQSKLNAPVEDLVKGGYIVPVDSDVDEDVIPPAPVDEDVITSAPVDEDVDKDELSDESDIKTRKEIMDALTEAGVEFKKNASTESLFKLYEDLSSGE